MALQSRHRWMIQKVSDTFMLPDDSVVENAFREDDAFALLTDFLSSTSSPSRHAVFVDVLTEVPGAGGDEAAQVAISVTDGMSSKLRGDAVYFVRAPGWEGRALDLTVDSDDALAWGTVSGNVLQTFDNMLSKQYRPLFDARRNWGKSAPAHTAGYLGTFDKFSALLSESLRTLKSGLELRKPDSRYDLDSVSLRADAAPSPELMVHFVELLEEWCRQTEGYLDESDQGRYDDLDAGPETELEYWRRRMQRLTSITEQLKTKECKTVIAILGGVSKSIHDYGVDQSTVAALMRRWKLIDINITEAANEAKDNVKFLGTLDKFIDPLYNGTPETIIETLPALLNSIKMIHTIARYYNTTERMTNLFMKITNQAILNCKKSILAGPRSRESDPTAPHSGSTAATGGAAPSSASRRRRRAPAATASLAAGGRVESQDNLWVKDTPSLLRNLEACLRLNEAYQDQYRITKDKLLAMPKGKQFDFSEHQIFGKFDLFCRRVIKLLDMFSTIHQFKSLAQHHLEGMDELIDAFFAITREFRAKGHDLLDFTNSKFDRDYVEFNVRISDLETALQHFINNSFESITSIEASLNLLKKFQTILQRENLKTDLDSKFTLIFHSYGLDLLTVQDLYEKHKHHPPIPRNLPPVAGNVMWARHLLNRIQAPMKKFESNGKVLRLRDSRKIIKTYNKVARTLVAFEYLWYEAWCKSVDAAKAGLQATLIVRHPASKKLFTNFDPEILQLIREAKCLHRMSVDIPESAKIVMLQEDKFKGYYNQLTYLLREYDRITSRILPVTSTLMEPHIRDLDMRVRPGMTTLTWTSMNIDGYVHSVSAALKRLDDLISKANDIIENRIEKNIKVVGKTKLVHLPKDRSLSLDEFVTIEEKYVKQQTEFMSSKNTEIELAVHDLTQIVCAYQMDASVGTVKQEELDNLVFHYNSLMYQALLRATKTSLNALKKRVCSKASIGFLFLERPFFEVDVKLAVPSVQLTPSLADIQRTVNKAALAVLRCSKSVWEWGQGDKPEPHRSSFFDRIGLDIEIVKVVLLLTGAFQGTKNQVAQYLATFHKYDWLWQDDMEATYRRFMQRDPQIEDFDKELRKFVAVEREIELISPLHNIGALSLNTKNLKLQLRNECRSWKVQYSDKVHNQAREQMLALFEYMRATQAQLKRDVDSIDSLRSVMAVLREVRERESSIEMEIMPILDMYQMLEEFLPGGVMEKEEMDQRSVLRSHWVRLVDFAEEVTDRLSEVQGTFKHKLTRDVREFLGDVSRFRAEFIKSGPMVPGITPAAAVERLNRFKSEFTDLERKREIYTAGEQLFALRTTKYPDLDRTKREVALLDTLYSLYLEVVKVMDGYRQLTWSSAVNTLPTLVEKVSSFDTRCRRLPKKLREWDAYKELRQTVSDFQDVLPLLQQLSQDCMKQRHWAAIMSATGKTFNMEGDLFKLSTLLDANLLEHKEDVEDVCESAVKQAQIETKLTDIKLLWSVTEFNFSTWSGRDVPILDKYGEIMESLEESQLSLQTMLSMRHVAPFKNDAQSTLSLLSDTSDTLELWLKVQLLWTSLESVFTGGDIAKQMPLEAKKFAKIDKDFSKLMLKAEDTRLVVPCCTNELLRNTLPLLFNELEKCQKSLEGYLEQKRGTFPRFYFVSNPVLLQILSQGSNPLSVQKYYEKIFDSIDRVTHDASDVKTIVSMITMKGQDQEEIPFVDAVLAEGNIEVWLGVMERRMQETVKMLCEAAAADSLELSPSELVDEHCAQMTLLGLQLAWTTDCTSALDRARSSKSAVNECNKKQITVLAELGTLCLSNLPSKMARTKVETLVTIQVHQRDVFADLARLFKERKLSDSNDFEWLKQARFYWRDRQSDAHGDGAMVVSVCDVDFNYSYEYLGCKERLVITPLTDRAYITLTQALGMNLGGAPAGPAGTGKTETVKDLGRSLGLYVVVTNCTDQQRYSDMAKIFKGLCQAGLWGCFDEFNRIELPVLSVVAQQVLAITNARRASAPTFSFPGDSADIRLVPSVGYFITMNPGYQGRQELPENLKALFRGVAMMVPDREIIMKVKLCSVGYTAFSDLAKKFRTLYKLCEEQLSQQKHYDFGLRNILSVLRTAGKTKRDNMDADEEMLLMRTLRDMNLSKLVAQDTPLFLSLLTDLFPSVGDPPGRDFADLTSVVDSLLDQRNLMKHPQWVIKVMQLYETTLVRHGIMLVGPGGSGKSTIFQTLMDALAKTENTSYKMVCMNPKAIRAEEMFGETEALSGEWLPGVFGAMWEKFNRRDAAFNVWLVCDGPVDAIWIENLNTVLDDNKILTLANGDRMPMTDNVKLMFEVENLRNASPATVSRAGIIFVSETDLDWFPVVDAWLLGQAPKQRAILRKCFLRYVQGEKPVGSLSPERHGILFHFLNRHCNAVMKCSRIGIVSGCLALLGAMLTTTGLAALSEHEIEAEEAVEVERCFSFCIAWAAGGLLEEHERVVFDSWLRQLGAEMPPVEEEGDTIFNYCVDQYSQQWKAWEPQAWEFPEEGLLPADHMGPGGVVGAFDTSNMLVPTVGSTRAVYLLQSLHSLGRPVMMTGGSGTAKTCTALMFIAEARSDDALFKTVNFSSATSPGMLQGQVEGELDRRGGKSFGPPGGKRLTVFLDDLNMPEKNEWGDQPTLEVVRQLVEYNKVAFLDKDKRGELKNIEDLQYMAAMGHPGGGKNDIPSRLKRHFFVFNMTVPGQKSIDDIYGRLTRGRFGVDGVPKKVRALADQLLGACVDVWDWCKRNMLPTPAKFHYVFNLRDLGRIYQGIMRTPVSFFTNGRVLVNLWRHECDRVFGDRLATELDKSKYTAAVNDIQASVFGHAMVSQAENVFVDFLHMDDMDDDDVPLDPPPKMYEPAGTIHDLHQHVLAKLAQHNEEHPALAMNLVMFDDAMRHLLRISRIIGMPRGNALLVGVGGSGKQSLTRLASYLAGHMTYGITLTKNYNLNSLLDDLRYLYKQCGTAGVSHTFLVTDAEIKDETFLEYFNSVLTTGEVANLFPKDEMTVMCAELLSIAIKERPGFHESPDNLVRFFYERVRANLHLVLCMSPVNPMFPERARKFPGLTGGCTIDWFLPWPKEALVSVSRGLIGEFPLECDSVVRNNLVEHMGVVHSIVVDTCETYLQQMRRHVYQTPKSFLSFLSFFKELYTVKVAEIREKEQRVNIGLTKLKQGAKDVEKMKIVLASEEVKLKEADDACGAMLGNLEISSLEAKREKEAVNKIKEACEADAARIALEKKDAEEDLAKAQPFLDEANAAIDSITAPDLTELKGLGKPSDIIKLVFDCVLLLKMEPIRSVSKQEVILGIGKQKRAQEFLADSYAMAKKGILSDINFLKSLLYFSEFEKDMMNDETIELLAPYMEVEEFLPAVARNASKAAEGLCTWVRAMVQYHHASKVVKPKLEALNLAEGRLQAAELQLQKATDKLTKCKAVLDKLQAAFEAQMADKTAIEENAARTRSKMQQATALIDGLAGERKRWTNDSREFADRKRRLPGDCALACAFVSYAGPFNQEFRNLLSQDLFPADLAKRKVPVTEDIDLTSFLVDRVVIGDWNSEGLPTDPLSIQNGIMVSRSTRYPLLIDPQGQGLKWVLERENRHRAANGIVDKLKPVSLQHPRLQHVLEQALSDGRAMIISGVEQELDPLLDPVLEKQIVVRNKSKYITLADRNCEYNDSFMLYITTRLPNPHFAPELQAKTTVVDFAVTQRGLEEQLLGRVIQKEQNSLEEQLTQVLEEVNTMTRDMVMLDAMLLQRLSANQGNLLDDTELIGVLADTKAKATEVQAKLSAADETRTSINEKREQYRPVATRGSVLYFAIVDFTVVNCMYQTSLDQFMELFMSSMDVAEKASLASKRIQNVLAVMTDLVVKYICRGLYERDKLSFKLICLLKILVTAGRVSPVEIKSFLKGGADIDLATCRTKTLSWLPDTAWLNVLALSSDCQFFASLPDALLSNEPQWRRWYEENEPEQVPIVDYDLRLQEMGETGNFYRLLVVRALRDDRTLLAVNDFIRRTEHVLPVGSDSGSASTNRLPAMGPSYVAPATTTLEGVYAEMDAVTPVIYLLSAGADPTDSIEQLARKQKQAVECVSMGEGQDVVATHALANAASTGSWVLLQNCHLGLPFMEKLDALLKRQAETQSPEFRLFITAEPHPAFPISLLQLCTKVTNEPPAGLRAGLLRSYTVIVDQGQLERVDTTTWRQLVYVICFLHSVVQERRKFGPLGWNIPYEFNNSDLQASLVFLEKHLYQGNVSWPTVQYMVSEVQYGGKITDDMDRRLFNAFASAWVCPASLQPSFSFNPDTCVNRIPHDYVYGVLDSTEIEVNRNIISTFPEVDSPEMFGLHPNADLTFRVKETTALLSTILDTQPKESAVAGGATREDVVSAKASELRTKLPESYIQDDVQARIGEVGGLSAPLNIFLFQEVQRLSAVIDNVRTTLSALQQAIHGEVVMTPRLANTLDSLFDARVPKHWVFTVGGDELSWLSSTLGVWFAGLLQRDAQLRGWLATGRPPVYWLTGFFNPQGFLTAMRQEVTRQHEQDRWALDDVVFHTEVLEYERVDQVRNPPREGVFVHGLFLDGAAWSRAESSVVESEPKRLFAPLPVLYVTAVTKAQQKVKQGDLGPFGGYECPCYKYPARTDRYLIFSVMLPSRDHKPSHWVLRGVALLCTTE